MSEEIVLQSLQKVEHCICALDEMDVLEVREELFIIRDNLQSLLPEIGSDALWGIEEDDFTEEEIREFRDSLPTNDFMDYWK